MSDPRSLSERIYARLLLILPASFRHRFGVSMQEHFRDSIDDARSRGGRLAAAALWLRTLTDLAATAVAEWPKEPAATEARPSFTGTEMLHSILDDLRYTGRALKRAPVFATVAILVIALGTGAVSTIFSVANGVLLRPLPGIGQPDDLVWVQRTGRGDGSVSASPVFQRHLAERATTLEGIAGWSELNLTIRGAREARGAYGNMVTGTFFDVLQARPFIGRFFSREEGTVEAAGQVVVVSHAFWTRELDADSSAVGKAVLVNGRPYTVIGVAPPRFTGLYPVLRTDAWVTTMAFRHLRPGMSSLDDPGTAWMELIARLRPGVTADRAVAELTTLTAQFAASEPPGTPWAREMRQVRIGAWTGLPPDASPAIAAFLGVLLGVAGMVLLIASVNVASMLLARAVIRRREIAIRLAIGAGARRLVRQLLTEALALFVLGGAAGIAVALAGTRLLAGIDLPVDVPVQLDIAPDVRVLAFTLLLAMVTGLLFGLAPALQATRLDLNISLRGDEGGRRRRSRMRNGLIVAQVALSLVLLVCAGLFTRALGKGRSVDVGFDRENVVTAALNAHASGYDSTRARIFYDRLAGNLSALPMVDTVGYTRVLPLSMSSMGTSIQVPGFVPPGGRPGLEVNVSFAEVDAGYFAAIRLPVVAGRAFTPADRSHRSRGVIVNEKFARRYWAGRPAVGQTILIDRVPMTVVGVARDAKYQSLNETLDPFLYLPTAGARAGLVTLLVRSDRPAAEVASVIRREIAALDPDLPAPVVTTLKQATAVVLLPQRAAAAVTGILGALGLVMAAIGLYGVMSFSTAQRMREMGVRLALGARPADLRRMIVGDGMRLVAIGSLVGTVLAIAATRAMTPFLFGLNPLDPVTFAAIIGVLGLSAAVASWLPARRAAAADPMTSLRRE